MNEFSVKSSCKDRDYLVVDNDVDVDSSKSALTGDGRDGSNVVEVINKSEQFSCFKSIGGEIVTAEQQSIDFDKGALERNISHSAKNSRKNKSPESCNYVSSFDYDTFSHSQSPIPQNFDDMLTGIHHNDAEIVMENNDLKNSDVSSLLFTSDELSFPENENKEEENRNMKNEKYLQKKKSKEEKMKMKYGRLKEKRSEYSARLKIRNTDAWNSMTEEQQNEQKINRKIQTQLCDDVSLS